METKIIHGIVDFNGNIIESSNNGGDFEIYKADRHSFRVIFKTPFANTPTVVTTLYSQEISQAYFESDEYSTPSQGCIVSGLEGTPLTNIGFSVFYAEEMGFTFMAIGTV